MSARRTFGRVRRLPSGRYQARYRTPDGVEHTAVETFARKGEADRYLSGVETDLGRGQYVDHRRGQVTLAAWAKRYMATTAALKPKTRAGYDSLLRTTILPELGHIMVGELQPITVREWLAALSARGLSASRVRQSFRLLSQLMSQAVENGLRATNPCAGAKPPRLPETGPQVLTEGQVAAIVAAVPVPYDLLVEILAYAGLRIGEAFALRRKRVDLLNGRIVVAESLSDADGRLSFEAPKSHQCRAVALPAFLVQRLARHLESVPSDPDALLFTGATGQPLRHTGFYRRAWRPAVAAAGLIDVTPHDLRGTHASWLVDNGCSVVDVAARLGHSAATVTTRHYARPVAGRDTEIASRLEAMWTDGATTVRARGGHVIKDQRVRLVRHRR